MIHATEKYNRIQDPAGIIPENEPVFLLRAQDIHAAYAVRDWLDRYTSDPNHSPERAKQVSEHFKLMRDWPIKKTPD